MKTHKDLEVWKEAIDLVVDIYNITRNFPQDERFLLVSQLRRSAVSIPSNIAEGAARNTKKENIQFLYIALGSLSELETQLIICEKLGFLEKNEFISKLSLIRKLISGLIKCLKNNQ